jgi:hypothetical protein
MHEQTIEELICRATADCLGDLALRVVDRQVQLLGRERRADLVCEAPDGQRFVVELKRDKLLPRDVDQVLAYATALTEEEPGSTYQPMLMGLQLPVQTRRYAEQRGVAVHLLDLAVLHAVAARLGVKDAMPAGPGDPHRTTLRTRAEIEAHWETWCPAASRAVRAMTVDLTLALLEADPRIAISQRRPHWTNITWPDGRLVAAINANRTTVMFDFAIPTTLRDEWLASGMGGVHAARSIGVWAQCRGLRTRAQLQAALGWFNKALPTWLAE